MYRTPYPLQLVCGLLLAFLIMLALPGCATSADTRDQNEEDVFIGSPPSPEDDDPFFSRALPSEAVPADASGYIGTPSEPDDDDLDPTEVEAPEVETPEVETPEVATPEVETPEVETPEVETPEVETPEEDFIAPPPEHRHDERKACFSCVRICPIGDDGRAACMDAPEDLICGWGSHASSEEARHVAQAQCDATLDMARHMPNYSTIRGDCPPATCR